MARLHTDVPKNERYSEKEFEEIVDVLARVIHGDNKFARISEVAGTYQDSLEFVKVCSNLSHKNLIQSLMHEEYPLPEMEGIKSYKEYKQYLKEAVNKYGELKDLHRVRVVVKGELNPLFVKNYDYIQKIDPDKFEGSVQQKLVDRARGEDEIRRKMQPSSKRMFDKIN